MMLNDKDVRKLLLSELQKKYQNDPNTKIINELGIDFGASRIDIAVVNGILHGYEIKSDLDTLERLPRQMKYYNKLFQRMTIVSSRKYYNEVRELVPQWWGIKIVSADGSRLIDKRKGRLKSSQNKELLLKLLWKKDLEKFIDYTNYPKSYKKYRKNKLINLFKEEVSIEIIRPFVYSVLKERNNNIYLIHQR